MEEKVHPKERTILIVEDDESLIEMWATLLKNEGFNVVVAFDGSTALDKIRAHHVDLVILDILLPNLNGYEFLRKLSQTPDRKLPVIIVTAKKLSPQAKEDFRLAGNVVEIFEKPLPLDILLLTIHKTLKTLSRAEQVIQQTKEQADEKIKKISAIEQERWKKI
jgi:CheY-like chemotaxis protein